MHKQYDTGVAPNSMPALGICLRLRIFCGGVKPLSEPAVHWGEQVVGLLSLVPRLLQTFQFGSAPRIWRVGGGRCRGIVSPLAVPFEWPHPPQDGYQACQRARHAVQYPLPNLEATRFRPRFGARIRHLVIGRVQAPCCRD